MKFVRLLAVVIAIAPTTARASSLWQVWQAARSHDPAFQAASAQLKMTATQQPSALAALLPQLSLTAGAGPQTQFISGPEFYGSGFEPIAETENLSALTWQATFTQTLFDWGALKTYQAAGLAVQTAAARYQATLEQLNVAVIHDYVAVLEARDNLAALRVAARGFGKQYHDAEARYRAGLSGVIGADEAAAANQSIRAQVVQAQAALMAAREQLAALTGSRGFTASGHLPQRWQVPALGSMQQWLNRATTGNPTLAAAQLSARHAAALIAAAQGGYLPSVALQLQHSHAAQAGSASYAFLGSSIGGPGDLLQQGNSVTVQMTWNLFSGGATRAAVERARAQRELAVANAATARLRVIQSVRTDYFAVALDRARLVAAQSAAQVAAKAVRAASDGVRAGLISESDLIADRQALLSAQRVLDQAVVSAITHQAKLAEAAGSATPDLVHQISARLTANPTMKEP